MLDKRLEDVDKDAGGELALSGYWRNRRPLCHLRGSNKIVAKVDGNCLHDNCIHKYVPSCRPMLKPATTVASHWSEAID